MKHVRQCLRDESRRGVTIIEILVTLGIISLLVALLTPSVQQARESSRSASCKNNLRQMGIACESFYTLHERYPHYIHPGSSQRHGASLTISGHVGLLPYLDQGNLFEKIDLIESGLAAVEPVSTSSNQELEKTTVATFLCPSDPRATNGANSFRACFGTTTGIHASWTFGRGPLVNPEEQSLWGVFCGGRKHSRITDGLSNTVAYSERLVGDLDLGRYSPDVDIAILERGPSSFPDEVVQACQTVTANSKHFSSSGATWLIGHRTHTAYNHVLTPNSKIPDCALGFTMRNIPQGAVTARSYHRGGVNACFADSAVRLISENIDMKVWRALGTIHGGEVINDF